MSAGLWFLAAFRSDCSWGDAIEEGDEIRADGEGGWEHRECAEVYQDPAGGLVDRELTVEELSGS